MSCSFGQPVCSDIRENSHTLIICDSDIEAPVRKDPVAIIRLLAFSVMKLLFIPFEDLFILTYNPFAK